MTSQFLTRGSNGEILWMIKQNMYTPGEHGKETMYKVGVKMFIIKIIDLYLKYFC